MNSLAFCRVRSAPSLLMGGSWQDELRMAGSPDAPRFSIVPGRIRLKPRASGQHVEDGNARAGQHQGDNVVRGAEDGALIVAEAKALGRVGHGDAVDLELVVGDVEDPVLGDPRGGVQAGLRRAVV